MRTIADAVSTSFARFSHNIGIAKAAAQQVMILKALSAVALPRLLADGLAATFDFVYVDGSHFAHDVLADACMSWQLLKERGIMVFDEYAWALDCPVQFRPKVSIDAFTSIFNQQIETVSVGAQYVVRKVQERKLH